MCVAQRPSVSDLPKGTLSPSYLQRTGQKLRGAVPPLRLHTDTQRGDLDLQAGTRDLSAGTQAWTLLQLARGEQAGFLHTRHDISELILPHSKPPPPTPSPSPTNSLCRLPAHLLPGPSLTEGMGSEHNLDTEFPHFTDGRERLCVEVRKQREKDRREGVSSPAPKRGRFHTATVRAKVGCR